MNRIADIQSEARKTLQSASAKNFPDRSSEQWRKVRLDGVEILSRSPGEFSFSIFAAEEFGQPLESFQSVDIHKDPTDSGQGAGEEIFPGLLRLSTSDEDVQNRWSWLLGRANETRDPFELSNLGHTAPLALRIKKDISLRISYKSESGNLFLPALYLDTAPNVEVDVILQTEDNPGADDQDGMMWSSGTFVRAGANARIRLVDIRKHGDMSFHFHRLDFLESRDSNIHYCAIHRGGLTGKGFVRSRATEKGAQFRGIGLYTGRAAQFHDMEMEVSHEADHCDSTLHYKTVLKDRAHSVFNGSLVAPPHIRQINSHQTNNNIVLSKKARAESMPRLIIQSEDVSCEHGATVGDLDEQALYFLQCRGIRLEEARRMLIEGFMEEILSELRLDEQDLEQIRNQMFPILDANPGPS
ncbi:MAG: SufD family Fe-S cluster assembly protein [Leptospiraceae bacterium]|nr:SufD family Fe-S cluster assembly protein [Leptospiraceae bacterium]